MKTIVTLISGIFVVSAVSARAADAKQNWDKYCVQCHGKTGHADTKMGAQLAAKNFSDAKVQASFTDAQAAKSIKEGIKEGGKTKMTAFAGKLTDDEVKALVAYVRTLK
jgi:mono/diheme cytochrome c family protein